MLDLTKLLINELSNNVAITNYVGPRIYMAYKPTGNTEKDYPQIAIHVDDGPTDSLNGEYFPSLQIHIWTKGEAYNSNANLIAKEVLLEIDKKSYLTNIPCVFQIWKSNGLGFFEDDTQVFHKILMFDVVMDGYT